MDSRDKLLIKLLELVRGLTARLESPGEASAEEMDTLFRLRDRAVSIASRLPLAEAGSPERYEHALASVDRALYHFQTGAAYADLARSVDRALYFSEPTTGAND